jgi:hypothetical protein
MSTRRVVIMIMHCSGISGVRPDSQRTMLRVITLCALDNWVYIDFLEEALLPLKYQPSEVQRCRLQPWRPESLL